MIFAQQGHGVNGRKLADALGNVPGQMYLGSCYHPEFIMNMNKDPDDLIATGKFVPCSA